jgi:hypothetical protein
MLSAFAPSESSCSCRDFRRLLRHGRFHRIYRRFDRIELIGQALFGRHDLLLSRENEFQQPSHALGVMVIKIDPHRYLPKCGTGTDDNNPNAWIT